MKRTIISRTFNCIVADCLVFDGEKVVHEKAAISTKYDTIGKAEKALFKENSFTGKFIGVESVRKISSLCGMYEDDFIRKATVYTERGKDTRNCITKDITTYSATIRYMLPDDSTATIMCVIPYFDNMTKADNYCRKNCPLPGKYIGIESVSESHAIYAMDIATFLENASPMSDRFTLITK